MAEPKLVPVHGLSLPVYGASARTILSRTSGFIARAGFTHSLSPARNCVYGCTYCYVPTLRIHGGLRPADWERWGGHTTYKTNAAALLRREVRQWQVIYCSPLVDPYQPAERVERAMPPLLRALCERPPSVFALQTRSVLVLRDLDLLRALAERTRLRVSFSLTTDREDVRRWYEPRCEPVGERIRAMQALNAAGIAVHATLAPLLPCDPARLADLALGASDGGVIADPLHNRAAKAHGATTRPEGLAVSRARGFLAWHGPERQAEALAAVRERVEAAGRPFGVGEEGFRALTCRDAPAAAAEGGAPRRRITIAPCASA